MHKSALYAMFAAISLASGPAAAIELVGFDSLPAGQLLVGETYVEDGLLFAPEIGFAFGGGGGGNPGTAFRVGIAFAPEVGDTLSIQRVDNGPLSLCSVDFASEFEAPSDQVRFIGVVSGTPTATSGILSSSAPSFSAFQPALVGVFDEIRIVVESPGDAALKLDNMFFAPGPCIADFTDGFEANLQ